MSRLFLAAVLAGGFLFLWGIVSWMVLPWHDHTLHAFEDPEAAARVLAANAPFRGIFVIPDPHDHQSAAVKEALRHGPFAFVAMSPDGIPSMPVSTARSLLIQILAAFIVALILSWARILSYARRHIVVVLIALAAGLITFLSEWNWWGFPAGYTLLGMADLLIGWFLAGFIIAKFTAPHPEAE